jgi:hypothetical protein
MNNPGAYFWVEMDGDLVDLKKSAWEKARFIGDELGPWLESFEIDLIKRGYLSSPYKGKRVLITFLVEDWYDETDNGREKATKARMEKKAGRKMG